MDLYLMRHGIAEDSAATDAARNLTEEGKEATLMAGKALQKMKVQLSAAYASPYNRTLQTAQTLLSILSPDLKIQTCNPLASGNDSNGIFPVLQKNSGSSAVLMVGHEPDLSRLISRLITGGLGASIQMGKGSVCKISFVTKPGPGEGTMEWLLTSRQIKLFSC
ncbi:MAG: phosphohistidine phosphatase SixA [Verrucomicrobiales bacterium]